MKESIVRDKSFAFAKRVVYCYKFLIENKEFILSKQLLRSGTAIGALIREADMAESKKDFTHKMYIALKEANETLYWIDLLMETEYIKNENALSFKEDCSELIRLLVAITKSSRK